MAELRFEAPLARFDCDEWNEYYDNQPAPSATTTTTAITDPHDDDRLTNFRSTIITDFLDNDCSLKRMINNPFLTHLATNLEDNRKPKMKDDNDNMADGADEFTDEMNSLDNMEEDADECSSGMTTLDNFGETFSGSLEDLVNTFDERITKSLRNYQEEVEKFAPVQIMTTDDLIAAEDQQTWWALTGSCDDGVQTDLSHGSSRASNRSGIANRNRDLDTSDLDYSSDDDDDDEDDDDDDDDEENDIDTTAEFDCLPQETLVTAEEVISEIEEMLEIDREAKSAAAAASFDGRYRPGATIGHPFMPTPSASGGGDRRSGHSSPVSIDLPHDCSGLSDLPVDAIWQLHQEMQQSVCELSDELIENLAERDELDYEKELKNQFIWLLLCVQKKKRETQADLLHKVGLDRFKILASIRRNANQKFTYVTTVIPYEARVGPPTIQMLEVYLQLLSAIAEDSSSVPGLLTDYILKVLCPKT